MKTLVRNSAALTILLAASTAIPAQSPAAPRQPPVWTVPADAYYPDAGTWERRSPGRVGLDSAKLAAAI